MVLFLHIFSVLRARSKITSHFDAPIHPASRKSIVLNSLNLMSIRPLLNKSQKLEKEQYIQIDISF